MHLIEFVRLTAPDINFQFLRIQILNEIAQVFVQEIDNETFENHVDTVSATVLE